jgi:hypothetical protein
MTYEEAIARVLNHAKLPPLRKSDVDEETGFLWLAWKADSTNQIPDVREAYRDLLACLDVINRHLNGAMPSRTNDARKSPPDRLFAYAVSSIVSATLQYYVRWSHKKNLDSATLEQFLVMAMGISCAWDAVLAGDIDSIEASVADHLRRLY